VYDAIGDTTVLCHIIKSYRAHRVEIPHSRLGMYLKACYRILQTTSDFSPEVYEMVGKSTLEEVISLSGPITKPTIEHAPLPSSTQLYKGFADTLDHILDTLERGITDAVDKALRELGRDPNEEPRDKSRTVVDKDGKAHVETLGEALANCYIKHPESPITETREKAAYFRAEGEKLAAEQRERKERKE
jgi:hypothetical protein